MHSQPQSPIGNLRACGLHDLPDLIHGRLLGRSHETAVCIGCRRVQPLKWEYCRLCWCQARLNAKAATGMPTVSGEVMTPWLQAVRHHRLSFVALGFR
ncbi:hypothetical protein [Streptomyces sp. ME19-01-6]|uniref:hypothetical protein n=1 Tax=Streptomyces sp. ME19-01-6 TaxID=3028686 RepID=UPI0029AD64FC|nr:hypothetical protein [Streptomyces sp. ME19-01-6]MDX3226001.1 hypothetical protein [Streptomyces sp. ME19-01-6]